MSTESAFAEHFARGRELALAGELAAAEAEYRAALANDPGSIPARLALATVFLGSGRASDAEPEFRAAWEAGVPSAVGGLALCLRARGAVAEARVLLESAVAAGHDDPLARDLLAELPAPGFDAAIEAVGLRFDYGEEWLRLRCGRCGASWEHAVASPMCVVSVACGTCGVRGRFEPEDYVAAAARLHPPLPVTEADGVDRAAAALVRGWHEDPALARVLDVGGMNAGALAEHPLMSVVLDALLAAPSEVE
jgi:tetratricopeptide (TPR) repeat protein